MKELFEVLERLLSETREGIVLQRRLIKMLKD